MERGGDVGRDERKREIEKIRESEDPSFLRVLSGWRASKELIYPGGDNWPTSGGAQRGAKDDIK